MGSTASHRRFLSSSVSLFRFSSFFRDETPFTLSPIPSYRRNRTHTDTHAHIFSLFVSHSLQVHPVLQTRPRSVDPFRLVFSPCALARGRNCGYQPRSRYPGNHEESFAFRPLGTREKDRWENM